MPRVHPPSRIALAISAALAAMAAPASALAADGGASDQTLRALLPVVALLGLATVLAVVELRRRRRKADPHTHDRPSIAPLPVRSLDAVGDPEALQAQPAGLHEMPSSVMSTGELEIASAEPNVRPTLIDGLVDESEHFFVPKPTRLEDSLDTDTAHMACGECNRAFEMGTRHCPFDGTRLHMTEQADVHDDPNDVVMVCPECASEHESDARYCPDDHARLIARTQGDEPDRLGHAPMLVCLGCAQELPTSAEACLHCDDGGKLRFMHGRKTAGIWVDKGPYTRICGECGQRYGEGMSYCSADGTELLRLN